jgi:hypothetical protein
MATPTFFGYVSGYDPKGVDAEVAAKELDRIKKRNGELTSRAVVEAARSKTSPIRPQIFDMGVSKAAEAHYRANAAKLLRSVVVRYAESPEIEERAYNVKFEKREPNQVRSVGVFASTDEILEDPEARAEFLKRALREADAWMNRYRRLNELAEVFAALERVS